MPKYFCDYCDVFLTHDSSSVRKAHNAGRNHLSNVRDWYSSLGHDKAQNLIDEITKMYDGAPAARPMGAAGANPMMRPGVGQPPMSMPPPPMSMGSFGMPPAGMPGMPSMTHAPPPSFAPPQPFVPAANPGQSLGLPAIPSEGRSAAPLVNGMNPERARLLGMR